MLLTRLTTEGLPHNIYMTFYISNIYRRRNNNNVKYKYNILQSYIISTLPLNKKCILLTTTTTGASWHNIIGRRERKNHQHHLLEYFSLYIAFFNLHTCVLLFLTSKPCGFSMYTSSSITPFRKVFFTSIYCNFHFVMVDRSMMVLMEVYLSTWENLSS